MSEIAPILGWWSVFAGSHVLLSSISVRPRLVARFGDGGFLGVYSLVALATFVPLCMAYADHRHGGALLWTATAVPGGLWAARVLGAIAFAFVVASLVQPSPTGLTPDAVAAGKGAAIKPAEARGLTRITRHPLFMSIGLWGLAHLFVNGFAADVAFFGGFPLYALIGSAHQDARKRITDGERLGSFFEQTSLLPFGAILTGRNRLVLSELPWLGLGGGLAAAVAVYLSHGYLFSA